MRGRVATLVPAILLSVLLSHATAAGQVRVAAEKDPVCEPVSGKRLERGAALPRKPTARQVRGLRTRLHAMVDATVERLAAGKTDALPVERFTLASSRWCIAARREFTESLITEIAVPKLDAAAASGLRAGLRKALEPAIDQIADAHAPEEGKVCYFSTTLGRWICIEIFIDIDIDIDP